MRKYALLIFCILSVFSSLAQKQVLYYSTKWEITPKELATYFRVCNYNSASLFFAGEVRDYTLDSTLVMKGSYSNYGTKDGEFFFYYPSGKLQAQGNFKKDLRDGTWKYYYEDGNMKLEGVFTNDDFSPVNAYDPAGNKIINNGTGPWNFEYEWYNQKERYIVKGEFLDGKKEGTWTCQLSSGDLLYRETFKDGQFKKGVSLVPFRRDLQEPFGNKFMLPYKFEVTEKFIPTIQTERHHYPQLNFLPGAVPTSTPELPTQLSNDSIKDERVFLVVDDPAEFPGGMDAMMKFLAVNVKYPVEARIYGVQGKVFVKFIVEKDGSISNIQIAKGLDQSLNKEAIRVISSFPAWKPGRQSGKPVRTQFVLPVYFKLER